jgi:hypothetical protein
MSTNVSEESAASIFRLDETLIPNYTIIGTGGGDMTGISPAPIFEKDKNLKNMEIYQILIPTIEKYLKKNILLP